MTEPTEAPSPVHSDAIAIVGMAGQFAGARDVAELWTALREGRELITHYDRDDLLARGVSDSEVDHDDYVAARGAIADPLGFDASFFGYSAREAELMDPQQRLLLETAWHVVEDAGLRLPSDRGRVGVFAATAPPTYITVHRPPVDVDPLEVQLGNDPDFAAARVAYKLGIDGPSIGVATACSSGLTAVHLACQSLINGDSDVALAVAASVRFPADRGLVRVPGSILAADGHCRAFAADADGTVEADGAAGVALRRLDEAIADGDRIHAVILGSAIGSDGADRAGFTAPGVAGQQRVLESALVFADVTPDEVAYVEAHGTGTPLGDPIETQALAAVYGASGRTVSLRIGSLKSNVGHLNHVAGIAGLIKVALSLHHGELPPSLHLDGGLNPALDLAGGRISVQSRRETWPGGYRRRVAAVSSFGMGGSGAHAVLTSAHVTPQRGDLAQSDIAFPVSAKSPEALSELGVNLAQWLGAHPEVPLADVAHTLRHGRTPLPYRAVVNATDGAGLITRLRALEVPAQPVSTGSASVLLFPGQGSEHPGMAAAAYASDPVFARHIDDALDALPAAEAARLQTYLLDPDDPGHGTALAQPALVAVQYAHARAWEDAGLEVAGMIGHSVGEITAATLAGVFTLGDAMRLAAARGRLVARSGAGIMLAVRSSPDSMARLLQGIDGWDLAAHNSSDECVIAGPIDLLTEVNDRLLGQGVATVPLQVEHAFHSRLLDPVLSEFTDVVRDAAPRASKRPYLSCVTGGWITGDQSASVQHWVSHLRGTVRFWDALRTAIGDDLEVYVALGPGRSAATHVRRAGARVIVGGTDAAPDGVARAWLGGASVIWPGASASFVSLPGYPFQHRSYQLGRVSEEPRADVHTRMPTDRWFYAETFRPTPPALVDTDAVTARRAWHVEGTGPIAEALSRLMVRHDTQVDQSDGSDPDLTVLVAETEESPNAVGIAKLLEPLWSVDGLGATEVLIVTSAAPRTLEAGVPRASALGAAAASAARVLGQENPHLRITSIDVRSDEDPDAVAAALIAAVSAGRRGEYQLVAGRLWARHLEPVEGTGPSAIRRGGTYLVIGGSGTIGSALATWLSSTFDAKVAVIGRRPSEHVGSQSAGVTMPGYGQIAYVAGDVSDGASLRAAWAAVESQLGPVNGVIHAAGESDRSAFSLVGEQVPDANDPHLRVKGVGADHLAELLQARPLDFVVGLSSLSVVLGGLGFGAYSAANAYLEARFAELAHAPTDTTWATLRLDSWQSTSDATGSSFQTGTSPTITPDDAPALFERAFRLLSLGTVTISVTPLEERIDASRHPTAAAPPAESARHPRPHLSTPYRPAADELEEAIIGLLEELLHIDGVGGDDDFFELGGHSLLAMTLASRLAETLGLDVNLRTVFDAPTAALLASVLEEMDERLEASS